MQAWAASTFTVTADKTVDETYTVTSALVFDTGGFTYTVTGKTAVSVKSGGVLQLASTGALESTGAAVGQGLHHRQVGVVKGDVLAYQGDGDLAGGMPGLGADSLGFLSVENLQKITPDCTCGFCDGCFTEKYPIPMEDSGKD